MEKDDLEKINLSDKDARFQKSHGAIVSGYRVQISVDAKEQVIVACAVKQDAADTKQLKPMLKQTFENTQKAIEDTITVTANSGYSSMENLEKLEQSEHDIDAYIPDAKYQAKQRDKQIDEDSPFHKNKFGYNPTDDTYLCPDNRRLKFAYSSIDNKGNRFSYYHCKSCQSCDYFGQCTKSNKGRGIRIYNNEHLIYDMRRKLNTTQGKQISSKRKVIIETVFGNIKHNLGFREFLLRGLDKVKAEFSIMAIAHNLLKIAKVIKDRKVFALESKYLIPIPVG